MIANTICLLQNFLLFSVIIAICYERYICTVCMYVFVKSSYLLGILRGASAVSIVGGLLDVQVGIVDDSCLGRFVTVVIAGNQ